MFLCVLNKSLLHNILLILYNSITMSVCMFSLQNWTGVSGICIGGLVYVSITEAVL
jgi:hypothetical protein